jgi:hypothetical protein
MSRQFLDIRPSNLSSTLNNVISYKQGQSIIKFVIPEGDYHLYGSSIRISGTLKITTDGATVPSGADKLSIDPRTGAFGMFDQVTLSSNKTGQVIEDIRHYNRFMATYLPLTASNNDLIGHLSQAALTLPASDASIKGVTQQGKTNSNEFCIYLPTGLLNNGSPIPMSSETIGGLAIELRLSSPSMFLFDIDGTAAANNLLGADYSLSDIKLTCEVEGMNSDSKMSAKVNGFEYNSISSHTSTINATNAILNYSLGKSRVQSVFINFIRSTYLNNLDQNSLQTIMPIQNAGAVANVDQLTFTRGGVRFPADYDINTNYKEDETLSVIDPQISRNFLNSITPFNKITRTQISPINTNRNWTSNDNDVLQGGLVWGVGISYDNLGSDGADFSTTNYGLQMNLELLDDSPNTAFVFVHAKETLLFNGAGIQVVS